MKKTMYLISILALLLSCKKDIQFDNAALLHNLEYPLALFIDGGSLYFTETASRNTFFGGKLTLNSYNLATNQKTVLKNNPINSEALVVVNNEIYLSCFVGSTPGQSGRISIFNLLTNTETHFMNIEIATRAMCVDGNRNIYLLGSSNLPAAKSLYKFPATNYSNPSVLLTGLGITNCIACSNGSLYYSDRYKIYVINEYNHPSILLEKSGVSGMAVSDKYLYYSTYTEGKIGRIDLSRREDQTLFEGISRPGCMAYDKKKRTLYFLTRGTSENQYKDGKLYKITNAR